ncbi:hypothetical protein ACWN8P_12535 [Vagococcus salmoninarum]|uniref:Uncharacterized protein n=1 Tax=Vagococcus salmoninarum TaxID=2739 RepID=A0A429ZSE0_9ENTE|nr:hypothetical protein [Vagococcus salmoninarum]RST96654.1 hypothetical protein CBF35_05325 [Vagococcus salmoninarum]
MTYEVIFPFKDLEDGNHLYAVGATFPRKGLTVTPERALELSSETNKIGKVLIKHINKQTKKAQVEKGTLKKKKDKE